VKFGNQQPPQRCIKARKFNDENGDGEWEGGEDWLNDWEFTLYRKENGDWVEKATATTTGSDWSKGTAYFGYWPVGYEYKIVETRQGGWACTNCDTAELPFILEESSPWQSASVSCCPCDDCKEVEFGNLQTGDCVEGDMVGADSLVIDAVTNTVSWDITNDSANNSTAHPLIIESINNLQWPAGNGNLKQVSLDGKPIWSGNEPVTSEPFTISGGWVGTIDDRTIEPADAGGSGGLWALASTGRTETLVFLFDDAVNATQFDTYYISVKCVGDGCEGLIGDAGPTVITLSSFAARSSAGGSVSPLWLGLAGLTVLSAGSFVWTKRRTG
jgi:hypothetical protein